MKPSQRENEGRFLLPVSSIGSGGKILVILLLALTVASGSYLLVGRVDWERANKDYGTAVNWTDLTRFARRLETNPLELAGELKKRGVSAVVTTEKTTSGQVGRLKELGFEVGREVTPQESKELEWKGEGFSLLLLKRLPDSSGSRWDLSSLKEDVVVGAVEFRDPGAAPLTSLLEEGRGIVRVHQIFSGEVEEVFPEQAVARYVRAVKERNIGLLYLRLLPNYGWEENLDVLSATERELTKLGFALTSLRKAKGLRGKIEPPRWLFFPFAPLLAGIFYLLLSRLAPEWSSIEGGGSLILAAAGCVGLFFAPIVTRQSLALSLALLGPPFAYLFMTRLAEVFASSSWGPLRHGWARALSVFLATGVLSTVIGLSIAALLTDYSFLLKVRQFRGVKVSLLAPFLLVGFFYLKDCHFDLKKLKPEGKDLFFLGLALGLFAFLLLRSGNFSFLPIAGWEESLRRWLEDFLLARPRFKEFLLGHPLLILWLRFRDGALKEGLYGLVALLLGFAGQISILNTFGHAHAPLLVSLLRTLNGVVLGSLVGGAALLLFSLLKRAFRRR